MARFQCSSCDAVEHILLFTPDACSRCGGSTYPLADSDTTTEFDFIATPEQAFLLVAEDAMNTVNIDAADLSSSTKRSRARMFALPEEPDAVLFMDRWQARFGPLKIAENRLSMSVIADWPLIQT